MLSWGPQALSRTRRMTSAKKMLNHSRTGFAQRRSPSACMGRWFGRMVARIRLSKQFRVLRTDQ
jgi:hypothetical protein